MAETTFGKELRALRNKKSISQFDLAVCMGWKGVSPVIQIEKHSRIPKPDTISRLVKCLNGDFDDECRLMGLAGYLPPMSMVVPSFEQVKNGMDLLLNSIVRHPHPAYVLDLTGIFWLANLPAYSLLGSDAEGLMRKGISVFDLTFNSRLPIRGMLGNPSTMYQEQILLFKTFNVFHQHEPYYRAYPELMDGRLSSEDYIIFKENWDNASYESLIKEQQASSEEEHQRIGYLSLKTGSPVQKFQLWVDRYLPSLSHFFEAVYWTPLDAENTTPQEQVSSTQKTCLKLWELDSEKAKNLLKSYRQGRHPLSET